MTMKMVASLARTHWSSTTSEEDGDSLLDQSCVRSRLIVRPLMEFATGITVDRAAERYRN